MINPPYSFIALSSNFFFASVSRISTSLYFQ
jgi:hypothetical protein